MSAESTGASEEPTSTHAASTANKKKSESQEQAFARLILTEYGFQATTSANYLKRLQNLRDELNYINETEWMFEPLEKKPSQ